MSRSLMLQGTGSDVGKTVLIAALCRAAHHRGIKIVPFKPQNMSNNAAIAEKGEISRAQWLQAYASKTPPLLAMNPILLKAQKSGKTQIIVNGKIYGYATAKEYMLLKKELFSFVLSAYAKLKQQADFILIEGAGSCSEINLRPYDIANMGFAERVGCPVLIVGDIDRGGVIASLVGSYFVLSPQDRAFVKGYLINKFRGDQDLFSPALEFIEQKTGWQNYGVIPFISDFSTLPQEDSLWFEHISKFSIKSSKKRLKICIPIAESTANFDDIDPLLYEDNIELIFVRRGQILHDDCDVVILLGSKNTIEDLKIFYQEGWAAKIKNFAIQGKRIIGLCGGYQMLGHKIEDPYHLESREETIEGLGLLDVITTLAPHKITQNISAYHVAYRLWINAYEIHMGQTEMIGNMLSFSEILGQREGCVSENGRIWGTYLHGIFHEDKFRQAFLQELGVRSSIPCFQSLLDKKLDQCAEALEEHLDIDRLFSLAR